MTVKTSTQTLLIEVMCNKTDRATKNEETVQDTHLHVVLRLFSRESSAVAHQVDEADSNGTIDVENQVILLGSGNGLNGKSVIQHLARWETLLDELLDELDAEIWVVAGLDLVANTWDELVLLAHGVDKVTWGETLVESLGELLGSSIKSTSETGSDGEETGHERGDKILAGTGGDNGVHGTGNSWTVIGSQHEDHLEELGSVVWKTTTEPEEGHNTADSNIFLEDVRNWHTSVKKLLSTIIRNGGDESSWLSDKTKLLSPGVVEWNLWHDWLWLWLDGASLDQLLVDGREELWEVLKGLWNVESGLLHGLVLVGSGLELRVSERSGVTELNLRLEHAGASSDGPGDDWLGDDTLFDGLNDTVLLDTSNFTEQQEDLAVWVGLISEKVVDEGGTWVSVSTNGNTLVNTVGGVADNVVKLVGHTSGLGDVSDGSWAVELGGNDVVHHTTSVTNLERSWLDSTNGSWADDGNALLGRNVENLTSTLNVVRK